MRLRIASCVLLLCIVVAGPVSADASLRAYASVLGQRSAELDDRIDAARALGRYFPVQGVAAMAKALNDPEPAIREAAAAALWTAALSDEPGAREAVMADADRLRTALGDRSIEVVALAAAALEAAGEPRESLVEVRLDVLNARDATPYARFIVARGLIGLQPPKLLAPALVAYGTEVYAQQARGQRGSIGDALEVFDDALVRLLDEGGSGAADALAAEAGTASPATPHVLKALATAPPSGWVELLLAAVDSPHAPTREAAWPLLGAQRSAEARARWLPRAIDALDQPDSVLHALSALQQVAGCCADGLERVGALARAGQPAEVQLAALRLLARASDSSSETADAGVLAEARPAALGAFEPLLARAPRGEAFDVALDAMPYTIPDDGERAVVLAAALRANTDPAAQRAIIGSLSIGGTRSGAAVDALRPFAEASDPATREAALRTLSAIAPAWRESAQRAAAGVPRAVAPVAPGVRGVAMMAMMEAVRSGDAAAIAKLVPPDKANAPMVMPDGSAPGRAPLDNAIDHCGLPQIDTPRLLMVVRTLLAQGADPERPGPDGDTPMTRAKYACPPEVMAVLAGD